MKKKTKILIAFVLIVVAAVVAYLFLSGKQSNTQLYTKVYNYTYGITKNDKNIVDSVDGTVKIMLDEINAKNFTLDEEKANMEQYLEVKEQYKIVQEQIINYGNFVSNQNSQKYLKPMNKAYSSLVKIYKEGYEYLEKTYLVVDFATLSDATKITYIENFNVKIENLVKTYNDFMFNAGMAYTTGAKNLTNYNNSYKLKISYYVTLINNTVNLTEENASLLPTYQAKIDACKNVILVNDFVDKYMSNNTVYDELVKKFKTLNVVEIVEKDIAGTMTEYIAGIKKVETQKLVDSYVRNVING